jgi:TetR/AcrR family tetracycline transcriptional repressor
VERRRLTRELIVAAALAMIDEDGLDALSMRKLGTHLGVDPMAVYYHVPNKAALFDGVVEAVLRELDDELALSPVDVVAAMTAYRDVLRRHPHALPVVSTRPIRTPEALVPFERILASFVEAGFSPPAAVTAMTCAVEYTMGHVIAEAAEPYGGETPYDPELFAGGPEPLDASARYTVGLLSLVDGLRVRL